MKSSLEIAVASYSLPKPEVQFPVRKAIKVQVKNPEPIVAKPVSFPIANSAPMGAEDFLKKMRRASSRNEKIELIHSYVGYNPTADFGTQEYSALSKAQRDIRSKIAIG